MINNWFNKTCLRLDSEKLWYRRYGISLILVISMILLALAGFLAVVGPVVLLIEIATYYQLGTWASSILFAVVAICIIAAVLAHIHPGGEN